MSYIESNLLADKQVIYRAKLHWIIFWKPGAPILLGCLVLFIQPLLGLVVMGIGAFALVPALIDYFSSEFGITNKRVIVKVGLIRRRTVELLLRHVEAISVDQSIGGRILGIGSVPLSGTSGVTERFDYVTDPLELRRQIQGLAS